MTWSGDAHWWDEHVREAGDRLEEYFNRGVEAPTFTDAFDVASSSLVLASPMIALDPSAGDTPEDQARILKNLLRVRDLARRLYERESISEQEIVAGKFVLAHFQPVGELAVHALLACRFALSSILMCSMTVVIPEQFDQPGPEAWCLAMHAWNEIAAINERDYEGRPKDSFWVGVNTDLLGSSLAHQVNKSIVRMGGTPVSPN